MTSTTKNLAVATTDCVNPFLCGVRPVCLHSPKTVRHAVFYEEGGGWGWNVLGKYSFKNSKLFYFFIFSFLFFFAAFVFSLKYI